MGRRRAPSLRRTSSQFEREPAALECRALTQPAQPAFRAEKSFTALRSSLYALGSERHVAVWVPADTRRRPHGVHERNTTNQPPIPDHHIRPNEREACGLQPDTFRGTRSTARTSYRLGRADQELRG